VPNVTLARLIHRARSSQVSVPASQNLFCGLLVRKLHRLSALRRIPILTTPRWSEKLPATLVAGPETPRNTGCLRSGNSRNTGCHGPETPRYTGRPPGPKTPRNTGCSPLQKLRATPVTLRSGNSRYTGRPPGPEIPRNTGCTRLENSPQHSLPYGPETPRDTCCPAVRKLLALFKCIAWARPNDTRSAKHQLLNPKCPPPSLVLRKALLSSLSVRP
jgi:hypothetical protein